MLFKKLNLHLQKVIQNLRKMKKNSYKIRLIILSVLAIMVYVFMIGSSFVKDIDDFFLGMEQGKTNAKMKKEYASDKKIEDVYYLNFLPKHGFKSFPDSMINLKNGDVVRFRSHYVKAKVSFSQTQLDKVKKYKVAENILIVISLFFIFYIPILFFKFVFSLMGEVIFDKRNIKILRKLGISLILFYAVYYAFYWCSFKISQTLFDFSNYKITISLDPQVIWVLLGIVVLLFAEILSKGSRMQEEQDLTI
ncbi:membrane hypothetical protein [uncultured Paludibacter sp.]|uniref:Transmembrane protein n=1 Tax=uncultured Paludibacter sp. TaxID=497635 RepID=A0A653AGG2_9BACT|nr:membrane hypothetical protein [uncultured Paludibacter sp.]